MQVILRTSGGQEIAYDAALGGFAPVETPCFQCGMCCSRWQAPVDQHEIETIAARLSVPADHFREHYLRHYPVANSYLIAHRDGACIFLRAEGKRWLCSIHDFRPLACQAWTPSLERKECRDGLKRLGAEGCLATSADLNLAAGQVAQLCRSLRDQDQS